MPFALLYHILERLILVRCQPRNGWDMGCSPPGTYTRYTVHERNFVFRPIDSKTPMRSWLAPWFRTKEKSFREVREVFKRFSQIQVWRRPSLPSGLPRGKEWQRSLHLRFPHGRHLLIYLAHRPCLQVFGTRMAPDMSCRRSDSASQPSSLSRRTSPPPVRMDSLSLLSHRGRFAMHVGSLASLFFFLAAPGSVFVLCWHVLSVGRVLFF